MDCRGHQCTVLGEGVWHGARKAQPREVVAICDHLPLLLCRQWKHEIRRKTRGIAPNLFVETLGGYTVKNSQIRVQNDPLAAQREDGAMNSLDGHE